MKKVFNFLVLISVAANVHATTVKEVIQQIDSGHWREARAEIAAELARTNLDFETRQDLLFQIERMKRIRYEFNQTRADVFRSAKAIAPSITEEQFDRWEKSGAVEFLNIDGTNWYFNRAAKNIFLLNPEAKALRKKSAAGSASRLLAVQKVIATYYQTGERYNSPRTCRITYTISVPPGIVPPGETIRAWLPFPHAGDRQKNIRLIKTEPAQYIQSPTNDAISSVYLEKPAATNAPTKFKIIFDYTSDAFYVPIDAAKVLPTPTDDPTLTPFLDEQPPQIIFSDEFKKLSAEIVGDETNPYLKARKIFAWVSTNITWTGAREYSTVMNLPHQALRLRHGDCGMKTLTFMTLCRLNDIPARWDTGWITGDDWDMHDWCRIYLAPYGWVPADVTRGLMDSTDEHEKWFYLGGIDNARLVLNTNNNQPLYPAKTFFRSEIVDFQRGEVEWRGGNLYFNQWNWNFNVKEIPQNVESARN